MKSPDIGVPSWPVSAILFICSTLFLFCGFYSNCWRVAPEELYVRRQSVADRQVLGRLVESRENGILSHGGLLGLGSPTSAPLAQPDPSWSYQFRTYLEGESFASYEPYLSQIGAQGMLFSVIDAASPFSPRANLRLLYAFNSAVLALLISLMVLWFFFEFGVIVACFVLVSALTSLWLTVFSRSLYMSTWAFFVPLVLVMYFLRNNRRWDGGNLAKIALIVCLGVFVKCAINGYEFISTALVMMVVPFVYYGFLHRPGLRNVFSGIAAAALGSFFAIILTLGILCVQITHVEGSLRVGVEHVEQSLKKRTHADADDFPREYTAALQAGTLRVLAGYMKPKFFDFGNYLAAPNNFVSTYVFSVRYLYLMAQFILVSGFVWVKCRPEVSTGTRARMDALLAATWASFLAPVSWYTIFKSHAFIHYPACALVWQMPFTLFGFAVCGVAVACRLSKSSHLERTT